MEKMVRYSVCLLSSLMVTFSLTSCGGSGSDGDVVIPNPTLSCAEISPSNQEAAPTTRKLLQLLMDYSCGREEGVLVGQNAGHGSQIADPENSMSYHQLVESLVAQTGQAPALLGLDYGHDRIFTIEELGQANQVLTDHWNQGGIVTINWVPMNPWINPGDDPEGTPGDWLDNRTIVQPGGRAKDIILNDLIDPEKPVYTAWRNQLDHVASALKELQNAGVVVLWRPMQELNGNWFWWGTHEAVNDNASFINLWRDMHDYFSNEKELNNLLWVYSPTPTSTAPVSVLGRYPGADYVDVIAGTTYSDELTISDYADYLTLGKPMGMGEFGPGLSEFGGNGKIDNMMYLDVLTKKYPSIAYWVSWHNYNYSVDGEVRTEQLAIVHNENADQLMTDERSITRDKLQFVGGVGD